ncbi:MAG TPA: tannase/feruloyl esterase family alpha/beta hydrolase [Bryobacteraceae bacterium]|nr:tannase/feruloyl esterase family alpha/beta hydrolase [Bryobacteraceae bacterium]
MNSSFKARMISSALLVAASIPALAASCESLASLSLPDTAITRAETVSEGAPAPQNLKNLPAFCRVAATLKPSADSDIKIEVWLPASGWNGKYEAVGNGGWSGSIAYSAMAEALRRGYAASSTDTGHSGGSASFALGHPEKLIDYAYRSEHEMTVKAKAIIAAFYGNGPKLAYWNGCSAGGKQALKEAQRFPADFDGIIAGAPGNNWTGRATFSMWVAQAVHKDEAAYIPPEKYPLIHNAVVAACDALDGIKDGILEDPTRCRFDPKILECKGADGPACLTVPQVEAARKIYSGAINPRTKRQIFPGLEPGSELAWNVLASPKPFAIGDDFFKYVVFKDPSWDYTTLNFDRDIELAEKTGNPLIDAMDPNLKPFFGHGGKLLQYHGWSDWQISPLNSVNYYQSVLEALGGASKVQDSYRLFMAPGMGHCGGSEGPNHFDMLGALEQWVEKSKPPAQIVASRITDGKVDRTRPLCPYPQIAKYKGTGSTDDAANFACALP